MTKEDIKRINNSKIDDVVNLSTGMAVYVVESTKQTGIVCKKCYFDDLKCSRA